MLAKKTKKKKILISGVGGERGNIGVTDREISKLGADSPLLPHFGRLGKIRERCNCKPIKPGKEIGHSLRVSFEG